MMLGIASGIFKRARQTFFNHAIAIETDWPHRSRTASIMASMKEGQMMLRTIALTVLTILSAPSSAMQLSDETILAQQQQQPPQQTPKRDCERNRDEGVSA